MSIYVAPQLIWLVVALTVIWVLFAVAMKFGPQHARGRTASIVALVLTTGVSLTVTRWVISDWSQLTADAPAYKFIAVAVLPIGISIYYLIHHIRLWGVPLSQRGKRRTVVAGIAAFIFGAANG